jgi:glucokinase
MSHYLGLDLGGTNLKGAVVAVEPGKTPVVATTRSVETHGDEGPAAVVQRMVDLGATLADTHGPFGGAGVGVPGLFDFATGEVVFFTNLPGAWEGFPLRSTIAAGLDVPTTLINDARAFTLAEATVGAGRGCSTVACLTLGTGVGGGLVINGELHFGAFGVGGELGHQTVLPDGPTCGCGNPGCMEALTQAPAIVAAAGRDTMEEVLTGAARGDAACVAAIDQAATYLGIGLANVLTVIGPERIVIGGGVAEAGDALLDPIRASVKDRITLGPPELVDIVPAELGPFAGAIGAALAAVESPSKDRRFLAGEIPSARMRREGPLSAT